jgi:hypothetical protein
MKTLQILTISLLSGCLTAPAQFNSGSDGSYGPMNISANTNLDLPANGIFNCTTITVAAGATLRFNRNTNNTPVYLLATNDVNIMGTIDVSGGNATNFLGGQGGPGGFDGGSGSPGGGLPPGDGYGPGAGKAGVSLSGNLCGGDPGSAGAGSYAVQATSYYVSTNKGPVYGSALLVPLIGGSGGGGTAQAGSSPGTGGGGGGGAILIASNTKINISGQIAAGGGDGGLGSCFGAPEHINPGSGGAIRLVAPAVGGSGGLYVYALSGDPVRNDGRVRIDRIYQTNSYPPVGAFDLTKSFNVGSYMVVFPPSNSRLDLIRVAGTDIPEGSSPVSLTLTNGTSPNQTVTVQARNFNTNNLFLDVVLTPQNGPALTYRTNLNNQSANPATVTVPVTIPVSTPVTVSAWTHVP